MSNLTLTLDMDRVQSSVSAAIRPTVDALLAKQDVGKLIAETLKKPIPEQDGMYAMFYGRAEKGTLLDGLVRSSIRELAQQYVERELRAQMPMIEEAFCKMLRGSTNKLVSAFGDAVAGALKDDFAFDFQAVVSVKGHEKSGDDE